MPEVVVRSRIKDFAKIEGKQLEVSAEVFPALCKMLEEIIAKGALRAKSNGRNTLMARDL